MALAMIVSMMGANVYAVNENEAAINTADGSVAKVGSTEYATIDEAIAAWTNNTTLTLLSNVTLSDVIQLKSTEHHILDLGTYTMTAASGKNAIEIKACGTGSAERSAITINADSTNPGGINAGSKSVIYYKYADGGISTEDRPIIKINGGVFNGSTSSWGTAGIYTIGTAARKCATLNISGGTFNCSINGSGKSKLIISGGTFNYSVGSQGDSTALRLISGGTFKTLGFMTADSNNTKFWIGTSMGNSNVGVYVDDNGYIVVGGAPITEAGETFEASSANYSGASSYLQYSSAATNSLYYTDVEEAFADNNKTTGSVTVHVDELDMTNISYKGTIVVPEGEEITIIVEEGTIPAWSVEAEGAAVTYTDAGGNVLEKDENGVFVKPAPTTPEGTNSPAYTKEVDGYVRVWGEGGGNAFESFVLKLYSDEELMATTELNNIGGIIDGDVYVTWNFFYPTSNDEYWTTTWEEGHPNADAQPTEVELYIDGTLVATTPAKMSGADDLNPVVWAELGGVKKVVTGLSGTGTEEDPYLINNIDELKWFRDDVNSGNTYSGQYVKVADDVVIDLAGEEWAPIGNSTNKFQGSFDGNGVVIKNLVITGNNSNVGFFGFTTDGNKASVIKNITIENAKVSGRLNVGVVAGTPYTTEYSNITVKGHVEVNGMSYVGGVFGKNVYANLTDITVDVDTNSYVKAVSTENDIAYRTYVGGVIGFMGEGGHIVKNVTSNINVEGDVCDIGGITGIAQYSNNFENVTCSGTVTGPEDETEIGGIAGTWNNTKGYTVTFTNCEYTGESDVDAIGAAYTPANNTEDTSGTLIIDGDIAWPEALPVAEVGGVRYEILQEAFAAADQDETVTLLTDVAVSETIKVTKNNITLDLNGKTITGTDTTTNSFALIEIQPGAELTINDTVGTGKITLTSTNNRSWNAYSSVISNQRGKLTINGGTIEHLGGTDMAYGIDNLTNGKGTYAETVINGGTIKSTYRAVRQFLNGVEAQNILTVNGGTIEGTNKSIWMQDPSKNANSGTLTVAENATLNGDVYLFVTEGSTEWPVSVSIAASAVNGEVLSANVPSGYEVALNNGTYSVEKEPAVEPPVEEEVTLDTRNLTIINMGKVTGDDGVERFRVAFCSGIDSLDYKEVGFEISYPEHDFKKSTSTTVVYENLTVHKTNGETAYYTPDKFGEDCEYLFFKTVQFGAKYDNSKLEWRPYAIKLDGTKLVGKTSTVDDIYTLEN